MFYERIKQLKERFERVDKIASDEKRTQTLIHLSKKIDDLQKSLENKIQEHSFFIKQKIVKDDGSLETLQPEKMYINFKKIKKNFEDDPKPESITKDNFFKIFEDDCNKVAFHFSKQIEKSWEDFKINCYGGEKHTELKEIFLATPENEENLRLFQEKEIVFEKLVEYPTQNFNKISQIKELGTELKKISERLDGDQPQEVKEFYNAMSGGGAPIELLTETVMKWLEEKGRQSSYRVVPKSTL